jgi:copper homeostasis protein
MRNKILLEIAVASLERAIVAERAGAHRLELCEGLELGGVTPSIALIRRVRSAVRIPIHAMVRPRAGDFIYTATEFARMKEEITALRGEDVQGIVTGLLRNDHNVDVQRTRELVDFARPLPVTFHRAFDEAANPPEALEDVILTGAARILTSAGAVSAADAPESLRILIEQAGSRIAVLPGGGLHAGNIARVARVPGMREIHTGLGAVVPYDDQSPQKFEAAIRDAMSALAASAF